MDGMYAVIFGLNCLLQPIGTGIRDREAEAFGRVLHRQGTSV